MDSRQAGGLAGADPFGDMGENIVDFIGGQVAVEERRALAFGEPIFAGRAAENPSLIRTIASGYGQVAVASLAVVGTAGLETTETAQVIHDRSIPEIRGKPVVVRRNSLPYFSH
jgi:hypothetical protein